MPKVVTDNTNNPLRCNKCAYKWARVKFIVDNKLQPFCYECMLMLAPQHSEWVKQEMQKDGEGV